MKSSGHNCFLVKLLMFPTFRFPLPFASVHFSIGNNWSHLRRKLDTHRNRYCTYMAWLLHGNEAEGCQWGIGICTKYIALHMDAYIWRDDVIVSNAKFTNCFKKKSPTHSHVFVRHTSNFSKLAIRLLSVEDQKSDGITDNVAFNCWHQLVGHCKHLGNISSQP